MFLSPETLFIADALVRVALAIRIIMRRRPVGVSLAWLSVVLVFPFFGAFAYLVFGELRLGNRRAIWGKKVDKPLHDWLKTVQGRQFTDWSELRSDCQSLSRLAEGTAGVPTLPGNDLELLSETDAIAQSLIDDINRAERTCHMEFYIWSEGGLADDIAEALVGAVQRGVTCRVLLDDMGSRKFLRSDMAAELRKVGVHLIAALPGGWIRGLFVRFDLRMHRKIVVIDGKIAYTGSQNIADPQFFKQHSGVGQWVDAMVRVQGPAVEALSATFLADWAVESKESIEEIRTTGDYGPLDPCGSTAVQVVPSGPMLSNDAIQKILIMAIYAARHELILTTPYFVPEESLLVALTTAAERGVDVTLIVPTKVDSLLVRMASQSFRGDLTAAGVKVALFDSGLLHTKSITVDGEFSFFGSLNLDPRSLHLNFEITLLIYDRDFTARLRDLQMSYLTNCTFLADIEENRSGLQRLGENAARLIGPLL